MSDTCPVLWLTTTGTVSSARDRGIVPAIMFAHNSGSHESRRPHLRRGLLSRLRRTAYGAKSWSQGMESNHRYTVLQTAALTTWLPWAAREHPQRRDA